MALNFRFTFISIARMLNNQGTNLITNPSRPVSRGQVVRIKIDLKLRQRNLEGATLTQPWMTGPALPTRIITKVQVNPVRVKMVWRLDDVITRKYFSSCASGSCLLFGGRILPVAVVHWQTLQLKRFQVCYKWTFINRRFLLRSRVNIGLSIPN